MESNLNVRDYRIATMRLHSGNKSRISVLRTFEPLYDRAELLVPRGLEDFEAFGLSGDGREPSGESGRAVFRGEGLPSEEAVRAFDFRGSGSIFEKVFEGRVEDDRLPPGEPEFDKFDVVAAGGSQRTFST